MKRRFFVVFPASLPTRTGTGPAPTEHERIPPHSVSLTSTMRTYSHPAWMPVDPDPPGRTAVVEHTCAMLSAPQAMVSLVAAPGHGATTVTGAVAARMSRRLPVCAQRLAGYRDLPQLFHAIGHALGAPFPRDQAAVCEALREAGPTLIILDDADHHGTETLVERLAAVALEARFLTVGRSAVFPDRLIRLPPLLGSEGSQLDPALASEERGDLPAGNLVLRHLLDPPQGDDPWAFLDDLPESADLLASFPAGIPGGRPGGVPAPLLLPSSPGRTMMRRCVAEELLERRSVSEHDLALALLPRCGQLLRVAEEPSLATPPHPADLAVVSFLARHHPDPGEAARAWAAWSRFVVAAGQGAAARVWQDADARTPRGGRYEALLAWAEGDALLADGEHDKAQVAFEFAAAQLRRDGDARQLANLHLRCADGLQARSSFDAADEHAEAAREVFERLSDTLGQAETLRSQACAQLAQGRPELARGLLEQASTMLSKPRDGGPLPCSVHMVHMALALSEGKLEAADEQLRQARATLGSQPLERGAFERLQGQLALHHGELDEARRHLEQALEWLGRAGARAAVGVTTRLLGDVQALAGQPREADRHYQRATREQVRAGDMVGLARTLQHRAALEREQGSGEIADHLEGLRQELLSLSFSG
jgi:tetratricopeptide (TPR) repeat protein